MIVKGLATPFIALVARFLFVCVGTRDLLVASYWIDTLVLKTEGNTYATLLHHPSSSRENQRSAQEVARRIYGTVTGEVYAQVKTYQVPITNSSPSHYIMCHLPLVFLSPTSPLLFYSHSLSHSPLFFACLLCACVLDCLSRWLKIILNCVTFPIPTITISLAL